MKVDRFGTQASVVVMVLLLCWVGIFGCASRADLDAPPAAEADLAIESVTIVDAIHGERPNHRVVLRGDRIVWVGPMSEGGPSAARILDGAGQTLIPGLWDAHVHFVYDEELTEAMPDLFLDWGITSVRDTGGDLEQLVALRERWAEEGRSTPRIFLSGPLLDGEHVVYDGGTSSQPPLGTSVPNAAAADGAVQRLKDAGADFIKIYELVSPSTFEALVAAARARQMPIASHVPLSLTADEAGPLVDSMEHLRNIDLACARNWKALLAERRDALASYGEGERGYFLRRSLHESQRYTSIAETDPARCDVVIESLVETMQVPTLRLNAFNHSRPHERDVWTQAATSLPNSVRTRWGDALRAFVEPDHVWDLRFADWSLELVGRLSRAGVPIAAGTDTPIRLAIPGESLHRELELLVESGLSTTEALRAATVEPARFFGLEGEMGQVAAGMRADLVLLEANPLEDIRNTRRIVHVISQGRMRSR